MTAWTSFRGSRLALATALLLPPVAWYGAQQGLGYLVRLRCSAAVAPGLLAGVAALLACAAAVWLALGAGGHNQGPSGRNDAVLRTLVALGAGVFGLAIAYQTLAVAIVPSCAR